MKIDRNNYEIYFLDYLEGRLPAEETAGLLIFANENPDLKELIEGDKFISLSPDKTITFNPKSALKRKSNTVYETGLSDNTSLRSKNIISVPEINSLNYEEFMIRFHEDDLNNSEKAALAYFLKYNPEAIREFELFENTLLKPDSGIIYPDKFRLKRNIIVRPGVKKILVIISMAASVLLFSTFLLKYIHQPIPGGADKQIARVINKSSKPEKELTTKNLTAEIKPNDINRSNNSERLTNTPIKKTNSSERKNIAVPTFLNIRQATQLPTKQMIAPRTILRRTDFDGITSMAYYNPDPDVLPISIEGKTIGGRLGYTLAKGISQTAGTIAREPIIGRLLGGKISLSVIADLGLAGYNLITDRKLSISRNYDSDGYLKGHSLNNGNKKLTRLP